MRVEAKTNKFKPKSFWQACTELWHAVSDDTPPDPMSEQLILKARKLGIRENAAHQMQSMGKLFGLSAQKLQSPDDRAFRIMRKCDGCQMAGHCFTDRRGRPDKEAHVSPQSCPNFAEYQSMARDIGSRTAIRNKLL